MIHTAPFVPTNLMAVVMKTPSNLSMVDLNTLKNIIEDRSFKIEGVNDNIHKRKFYVPLFPEFTLNETEDRDVERFVTRIMSNDFFEMDIMFIEPSPIDPYPRRAWLCQRMSLDTFTGTPAQRNVGGPMGVITPVSVRFACQSTCRDGMVMQAAGELMNQMKLMSSNPTIGIRSPQSRPLTCSTD